MAVVIRLQRAGTRHRPFYRVVVTDSRNPRDGAFLAKVGYYDPMPEKDVIQLENEEIEAWMKKGARPTEAVQALIRRAAARSDTASAAPKPEPAAEAVGTATQDDSGSAQAQPEA